MIHKSQGNKKWSEQKEGLLPIICQKHVLNHSKHSHSLSNKTSLWRCFSKKISENEELRSLLVGQQSRKRYCILFNLIGGKFNDVSIDIVMKVYNLE